MSIANLTTKALVSGAIVLGSLVVGVAPASAGTGTGPTPAPNPFSGLSCNCRETAPLGSPDLKAEINRGLQEDQSALLPGLPAPTQPR